MLWPMSKPGEHIRNANRALWKAMGWCEHCGAEPADQHGRAAEPHADDCPAREPSAGDDVLEPLRRVAS